MSTAKVSCHHCASDPCPSSLAIKSKEFLNSDIVPTSPVKHYLPPCAPYHSGHYLRNHYSVKQTSGTTTDQYLTMLMKGGSSEQVQTNKTFIMKK